MAKESESGAKRSGMAVAGLVLGIIALVTSLLPIINNLSAVLGLLGAIFAVVGVVGAVRGKNSSKVMAVVALVVNIVAIALVLSSQAAYSDAIDKATNGPSAVSTTKTDDKQAKKSDDAAKTTDLAPGSAVSLENGVSVSVDSVEQATNYDGSTLVKVTVTYKNDGDESASYNEYDWKGEDANGAQETGEYLIDASGSTDDAALGAGDLAAGGTKTGTLYYKQGTVKVLYFSSALSKKATASWNIG